jgi:ribonuclease J
MVRVIPLGGLGEIGLNAMAVDTGDDVLLVDAGLMFAGPELPGVGIVVPDFAYLRAHAARFRGVVLTHGHEDHVGALPYLLRILPVPVYGTPFTLALARNRCEELGIKVDLRPMAPREPFAVGGVQVEPIRVAHSIPDGVGLALRAGGERIVHTGDFKLDPTPTDGRTTDLERLGELGDEGVSLLLSDSTNAEEPGESGSELEVAQAFERIFARAPGRIVVALFSSNVGRIQHLFALCERVGRAVVLNGRSLVRNVELARELGLLRFRNDLLVSTEAAAALAPTRVLVLATGSQAEPRAGLWQMAFEPEALLPARPGDTFVLSARVIPGNERAISQLVSQLTERGATVLHSRSGERVHVSGHAAQGEQRRVLERVRPRAFTPIHGEVRHLVRHLSLAREAGVWADGLLLARDGDVISLGDGRARVGGTTPCGRVFRDQMGDDVVSAAALAERQKLAETGVIVATLLIDRSRGAVVGGPRLAGRGLSDEESALLPVAARSAEADLSALSPELLNDDPLVEETLVRAVRRAVRQTTGKRPTVVPVLVRL